MTDLLSKLKGSRTYAVVVAGIVLIIGNESGWWKVPTEMLIGLQSLALFFLRAAMTAPPPPPSAPVTAPPPPVSPPPTETTNTILPTLQT